MAATVRHMSIRCLPSEPPKLEVEDVSDMLSIADVLIHEWLEDNTGRE